jgi:hypothetical protein
VITRPKQLQQLLLGERACFLLDGPLLDAFLPHLRSTRVARGGDLLACLARLKASRDLPYDLLVDLVDLGQTRLVRLHRPRLRGRDFTRSRLADGGQRAGTWRFSRDYVAGADGFGNSCGSSVEGGSKIGIAV